MIAAEFSQYINLKIAWLMNSPLINIVIYVEVYSKCSVYSHADSG
jgi:hypothetical protein